MNVAWVFLALALFVFGPQTAVGQSDPVLYKQKKILLENVRIIDVVNMRAVEDRSLLISDGMISQVEESGQITGTGAVRLDLGGKTVLPGLVMLHEHLNYFSGRAIWDAHPVSFPKLFLAAGVTTLRTAGSENPTYDLNLKNRIDTGNAPGPTIYVTGPFFNDPAGGFLGDFSLSDYDSARKATAFWADRGCTSFKVYSDIKPEVLKGVIDEAHSRGLVVTGHLGKISCTEAAKLGIDNIEHGFGSCGNDLGLSFDKPWKINPDDNKVRDLIDLLVARKVVLTVTPWSDSDVGNPVLMEYLSVDQQKRINGFLKNKPPHMPRESNDSQFRPLEKLFVQKGGTIVLGADATDFGLVPGFQNHNALVTMVKAGWTPLEIIRIATIGGAEFLKAADKIGSIESGKAADLIVVSGEPDKEIADIRKVEMVFKNGIAFDPTVLRNDAKGLVGIH